MRRRTFLGLAGAAAAFPRVALGQQSKVPRVAWLSIPVNPIYERALVEGLSGLGYIDGQTIAVEVNTAPVNADLPEYVRRIVTSEPAVIVPYGLAPALAAKT